MGFLEQVVRGAEYRSTLSNPPSWLSDWFAGPKSASGQSVSVDRALGLIPFYAAVTLISETIGVLPLKVYRDMAEGDKAPSREHRAWRMLHDMPNPLTPAHRFWSTVTGQLLLWGNSFIEKRRGVDGLVDELWLLDPSTVIVEWDAKSGTKRFLQHMTPTKRWSMDEVLHITGWSKNGVTGESVLRCKNAIGSALAREEFEGGFYDAGVVPAIVLKHQGRLTKEAAKQLKSSFEAAHAGAGRSHGTVVLEEGMELERLTMPLRDLEFVQSQQLTRTDIAVLFHIPPAYLGGTTGDSLTYATVESNQIQFAQNAIAPWTNAIAKALAADRGIFPFSSWYPEFVLEGLMRGDAKSRGEFYNLLSQVDAVTVNEIRAMENKPPIPNGNKTPSEFKAANAPAPVVSMNGDSELVDALA